MRRADVAIVQVTQCQLRSAKLGMARSKGLMRIER
jgi:hypothetical protein